MKKFINSFVLICLLLIPFLSKTQVSVNNTNTVEWYVRNVFLGGNANVSNITVNGAPANISNPQVGEFTDPTSSVGLSSGMIIGTGDVTMASQPNTSGSSNLGGTGLPGSDPDLSAIVAPNQIYDELIIEFDFVPNGDTIKFKYVFASEEYEEFVCSYFNDVFGFFLTGNKPGGGTYNSQNIALVPDPLNPGNFTNTPVAINTVNPGVAGIFGDPINCAAIDPNWASYNVFYKSNGTTNYEYDGRTVALPVVAPVYCGQSYHIKIAIADAGDPLYDSGVLLEAGSFTSNGVIVDAGPDQVVCNGTTVTLGGSPSASGGSGGPYTYSWTPTAGLSNPTSSNPTVIPPYSTSTTYYLTVTDPSGCSNSDSVIITTTVCCLVQIIDTIYSNITCYGANDGSIQIIATGGAVQYSINNGASWQSSNTFTGLGPGTYQCIAADNAGCTDTVVVNITEPPQLTTPLVITNVSCYGGSDGQIVVAPQGGTQPYFYSWSSSANTGPIETGLSAGNVQLTVTDANGCFVDTTLTVTEPNPFNYTATSTYATCGQSDGSISITNVTGGTPNYTYSVNGSAPQDSGTFNNLAPGNYTITIYDANSCDTSFVVNVGTIAGFNASITNYSDVLCNSNCDAWAVAGTNGGTSPFTYNWSNGTNLDSAYNLCAGSYWVAITDANNCTDTAYITINEPAPLNLTAFGDTLICINGTAFIGANVQGGTAPYTLNWNNGLTGNGPFNVSPNTSTIYSVYATDANGCISPTDNVVVDVYDSIIKVFALSDQNICPGNTVSISAIASGGNGVYNYQWFENNTPIATTQTINVSPTVTTTYQVQVTDGCESPPGIDSVTITVYPLPQVTFVSDTNSGCSPLSVNFYNTTALTGNNCIWDFGDGSPKVNTCDTVNHIFTETGYYDINLTVYSPNNCINDTTFSQYIFVAPYPEANFTMTPNPTTTFETNIQFINKSSPNAVSWFWDFAGFASDSAKNPSFNFPADTGDFPITLIAYSSYNCPDTIIKILRINGEYMIYIPNAFTPNNDDNNEIFIPKGFGISKEDYHFIIFDRWGTIVFETTNLFEGWNGRFKNNGVKAPQGVYAWKIEFKDINGVHHIKIGKVTLLR